MRLNTSLNATFALLYLLERKPFAILTQQELIEQAVRLARYIIDSTTL